MDITSGSSALQLFSDSVPLQGLNSSSNIKNDLTTKWVLQTDFRDSGFNTAGPNSCNASLISGSSRHYTEPVYYDPRIVCGTTYSSEGVVHGQQLFNTSAYSMPPLSQCASNTAEPTTTSLILTDLVDSSAEDLSDVMPDVTEVIKESLEVDGVDFSKILETDLECSFCEGDEPTLSNRDISLLNCLPSYDCVSASLMSIDSSPQSNISIGLARSHMSVGLQPPVSAITQPVSICGIGHTFDVTPLRSPLSIGEVSDCDMGAGQPLISVEGTTDNSHLVRPFCDLLRMLLDDDDQAVMAKCAIFLKETARRKKVELIIAFKSNIQLSQMLLRSLEKSLYSRDSRIIQSLLAVVYNLIDNSDIARQFYITKFVPVILSLISCPDSNVSSTAAACLHQFLLSVSDSVQQMREYGAVVTMVEKLRHLKDHSTMNKENLNFIMVLVTILRILNFKHEPSKLMIRESGGTVLLVRTLEYLVNFAFNQQISLPDWLKFLKQPLRETTSCIKTLSVCPQNKETIIRAGGVQLLTVIVNRFKYCDQPLLENCLQILQNLSDAAVQQQGNQNLLLEVLSILDHYYQRWPQNFQLRPVISYCVAIVMNLTCKDEHNKMAVFNANGISVLLNVLSVALKTPLKTCLIDLIDSTIAALRHLSSGHRNCSEAQDRVRTDGGLTLIHTVLDMRLDLGWSVLKTTLGLLKNLSVLEANQIEFHRLQCTEQIAEIFIKADADLKNGDGSKPVRYDRFVMVQDIAVLARSTLISLAQYFPNRSLLDQICCADLRMEFGT